MASHKYIARVKRGNGYRYFYTPQEYQAYVGGAKAGARIIGNSMRNTANNAINAVTKPIRSRITTNRMNKAANYRALSTHLKTTTGNAWREVAERGVAADQKSKYIRNEKERKYRQADYERAHRTERMNSAANKRGSGYASDQAAKTANALVEKMRRQVRKADQVSTTNRMNGKNDFRNRHVEEGNKANYVLGAKDRADRQFQAARQHTANAAKKNSQMNNSYQKSMREAAYGRDAAYKTEQQNRRKQERLSGNTSYSGQAKNIEKNLQSGRYQASVGGASDTRRVNNKKNSDRNIQNVINKTPTVPMTSGSTKKRRRK